MIERSTEFARQVFRDLRDRQMLIPVIALVVAIFAVPIVLGGGSSSVAEQVAPTIDSAPASMTGAAQLDPVVLTDIPGLRNSQQRLGGFGSRNPFKQQMIGGSSTDATGTSTGGTGTGSGTGAGTSSSSSTSTSPSTSTSAPTVAPPTTDTTTGGGAGNGGGGSNGSGGDKVITYTIDIRVGRAGETKVRQDVKSLAFLPGNKTPVVQYVAGGDAGAEANFVLSPDVTATEGDGRCNPGRNNCQYLTMKQGDERLFEYGAKAKIYRLQLLAIHRVTVKATVPKSVGRDAVKATDGVAGFVATLNQ